MSISSIDWTAIAAIWMGGIVLLVPLVGLVLRYAVAPVVLAAAEYRRSAGDASAIEHQLVDDLDARLRAVEIAMGSGGAGDRARRSA